MTNIFINRNRSQGVYGNAKHIRGKNLSEGRPIINNDTQERWLARSKLKSDDFYK